jgi:mono/diheme cytochrome c family protein
MMDSRQKSSNGERRIIVRLPLLLAALSCCILAPGRLDAQSQKSAQPDQQFQTLIRSTQGVDLFHAYCASCHGRDAKGRGPAAPALKATVPDLTLITRNNGGEFPADRIRRIISGEHVITSHGSREMPIWGPIFHQIEADIDRGNVRMENLIKYLESIQAGSHA